MEPARTEGGRRLYSDRDIEHLRLLREATGGGRRIGDVSRLSRDELEDLVREDRRASLRRLREDEGDAPGGQPSGSAYLRDCLAAVKALDAVRLEATLDRAVIGLRPLTFVEEVAGPLMREIGRMWRAGRLTPGHERLASGVLRATLAEMTAVMQVGDRPTSRIVVATPQGQTHELGAMLAAVTAAEAGWQVTYLGADLPTIDVAAAAREIDARAVALSIIYPADDPGLDAALRDLGRTLPAGVTLFVGGAAAGGYRETLEEIGARILSDTRSFQTALRRLRSGPGANGGGASGEPS